MFFFFLFFLFYRPDWSRVVAKIFLAVHLSRTVGCSLCRNRTTSSAFGQRCSTRSPLVEPFFLPAVAQ